MADFIVSVSRFCCILHLLIIFPVLGSLTFSVNGTFMVQTKVLENTVCGIVALIIDENLVYIGWPLLRNDPEKISFNVCRKEIGSAGF